MSAGARIAARYRGYGSNELRAHRENVRNPRCIAAIEIVLTERQESYQEGFDSAQVVIDAVGGQEAKTLHAHAINTAAREAEAKRFREAEQAMGVADALWDYLRDRADT